MPETFGKTAFQISDTGDLYILGYKTQKSKKPYRGEVISKDTVPGMVNWLIENFMPGYTLTKEK